MGVSWAQLGSLNAPQAARLGVLPAAQQQALTVQSGATTVTLAPFSGRTARGRCGSPTPTASTTGSSTGRRPAATPGSVRRTTATGCRPACSCAAPSGLPDTSLLLDGTPTAAAGWNGDLQEALPVGTAVPVSGGDFTVVVTSADAPTGAVLTVTPTPPAAAAAAAPAPGPGGSGSRVLPGAPDPAPADAPQAGDAAGFWAPPSAADAPCAATPALASAADSTSGIGFLVPLALATLAGGALLVVRTARRARFR